MEPLEENYKFYEPKKPSYGVNLRQVSGGD